MTAIKIRNWEEKKIKEMWKDGKKFWAMIRKLLEIDRDKEKQAHVYGENGEKNEIMEVKTEFRDSWKVNVYQKAKKTDFSFWYKSGGERKKMIK